MKMTKIQGKSLMMICYIIITLISSNLRVDGASEEGCFFIFGDSMSDNGNNNEFETSAKANYKPYGIDFPNENPTGRFTNGLNLADFIAKFLGFNNSIPPFTKVTDEEVLKGVNYASGGSGILEDSGNNLGKVSSLSIQLQNHHSTTLKINLVLKNEKSTEEYLKKCMYMVETGANDYLNNFFLPISNNTSRSQLTPKQFAKSLTSALSQKLKTLYQLGARKVAIFGVGALGCSPYARANFPTNGSLCVDNIDNAVQFFNNGFKSLIDQLNSKLPSASFTFIDLKHISLTLPKQGDMILDAPCCEVENGAFQCIPNGKVCEKRTKYAFWDAIHLTEIVYGAIASRAFNAQTPNDSYPFDINHLSKI